LGANHAGEIAFLTHLVHPDVAIITNAAAAHLEGFGDIEGVACAKGEIFQGLSAQGVAVINADDSHADFWRQLAGSRRILTFGVKNSADVMARNIRLNEAGQARFDLVISGDSQSVQLPLMGVHNVHNALAAAAAGHALGLNLELIKAGLDSVEGEQRRLFEYKNTEGALIIDDSYNANPLSMRAAINLLAERAGERILVIGDMKELGENSLQYHQNVGVEAKTSGIEQLYCYGDLTRHAAQSFGKKAYFFSDQSELVQALKPHLRTQVTVLVKGSKSMQMDKVVAALRDMNS
jgi:UDP-N-acetylmuramoyl-tripeptide--D-alanyl-D-alanine ligase